MKKPRNLAPYIQPLSLKENDKADLVAFLLKLTNEQVRYEKAPFDHPSLCLPNGHPRSTAVVTNDSNGSNGAATDNNPLLCLNAEGNGGSKTLLSPFMDGIPK